jgi:hypothetical protein
MGPTRAEVTLRHQEPRAVDRLAGLPPFRGRARTQPSRRGFKGPRLGATTRRSRMSKR